MKNRVIVTKAVKEVKGNDRLVQKEFLEFHLKNKEGTFWLFTQPFSKGVYEWFKNGRSENEVRQFAKWNRNKRLENTILRIPREVKYVKKYVIDEERVA